MAPHRPHSCWSHAAAGLGRPRRALCLSYPRETRLCGGPFAGTHVSPSEAPVSCRRTPASQRHRAHAGGGPGSTREARGTLAQSWEEAALSGDRCGAGPGSWHGERPGGRARIPGFPPPTGGRCRGHRLSHSRAAEEGPGCRQRGPGAEERGAHRCPGSAVLGVGAAAACPAEWKGGSSGSCCPGGSNSRARVSVKNFIWCLGSVSHWPNVCPMTVPEPVAEQWTWSVASPWGAWSCRLSSSSGAGMVPARDAERMTP